MYKCQIRQAHLTVRPSAILRGKQLEENMPLYRRRQAIVEHPYGTIKRYWGFSYIVTKKGIERAAADVGLMFTAYTLKRIMNILDPVILKAYLKELTLLFGFKKVKIKAMLSRINTSITKAYILQAKLNIA